jgi:hypothetical protein
VLFAIWVGWRERSWARGIGWGVAICLLGNLVTIPYLLWHLRGVRGADDLPRFFLGRHASS